MTTLQIKVENLTKIFNMKIRSSNAGIFGAFKRVTKNVTAVDNISFTVNKGETIAFIGPNGAGKSTTIKILTGILYPSSGYAKVAGFTPWEDRQKLAFKIGTVFGQKSQLSYHLPAIDSFKLFSKIYELDKTTYEQRLNRFVELFNVKDFIQQPLRKLSLGQRMRCEIIASLLHNPEIIFLDEPTIGLDVVAKRNLREVLKTLNKELGTTIFLTSHDTADIEALAERTIIINKGQVVYDNTTKQLKQHYFTVKRINIVFDAPVTTAPSLKHVNIISQNQYNLQVEIDIKKHAIRPILENIIKTYPIADISIENQSLDEIIANIYEHGAT